MDLVILPQNPSLTKSYYSFRVPIAYMYQSVANKRRIDSLHAAKQSEIERYDFTGKIVILKVLSVENVS
jgi:hypothetical protein